MSSELFDLSDYDDFEDELSLFDKYHRQERIGPAFSNQIDRAGPSNSLTAKPEPSNVLHFCGLSSPDTSSPEAYSKSAWMSLMIRLYNLGLISERPSPLPPLPLAKEQPLKKKLFTSSVPEEAHRHLLIVTEEPRPSTSLAVEHPLPTTSRAQAQSLSTAHYNVDRNQTSSNSCSKNSKQTVPRNCIVNNHPPAPSFPSGSAMVPCTTIYNRINPCIHHHQDARNSMRCDRSSYAHGSSSSDSSGHTTVPYGYENNQLVASSFFRGRMPPVPWVPYCCIYNRPSNSDLFDTMDCIHMDPFSECRPFTNPANSVAIAAKLRMIRNIDPISPMNCPICWEELKGKLIKSTDCGHIFCANCIDSAIDHKNQCPICQKPLQRDQIHRLFLPGY